MSERARPFWTDDFVCDLRGVADGSITGSEFYVRDWRRGQIAMMLWEAADEIERLRSLLDEFAASGKKIDGAVKELRRSIEDLGSTLNA